jgi:hypothetical protein
MLLLRVLSGKEIAMKLYVFAIAAAFSSLTLASCVGGTTTTGPAGVPDVHAIGPLTNSVVVTALRAKKPIPHLEIRLTRTTWPSGKLIAKGATGPQGRVRLSGNWTAREIICAGGKYYIRSGYITRYKCEQPFPKAVTLDF